MEDPVRETLLGFFEQHHPVVQALITQLVPYSLAFAAGAMIYVVVEELIPESYRAGHDDYATLGAISGFAIMMTLDVAWG